jgi:hypothetical protein
LCRAGIALLYAHWEGYAKYCLSQYLAFVARRRLKHSELRPGFVGLSVEARLDSEQGMSQLRRVTRRVEVLVNQSSERATIPWRKGIETKSNLSSDRCFDLFDLLGLDDGPLRLKAQLIDYDLLRPRNEVAHGQYLSVDRNAYSELHHEVLFILDSIRNTVMAAAENGWYRAQ